MSITLAGENVSSSASSGNHSSAPPPAAPDFATVGFFAPAGTKGMRVKAKQSSPPWFDFSAPLSMRKRMVCLPGVSFTLPAFTHAM